MGRRRYRLRFTKRGNLCFIGHLDLLKTVERTMRRAQLPLAMSEGFHPKPRVSYLSALPLGYSSDDEAMELILEEDLDPQVLKDRLNEKCVPGLEFVRVVPLDEGYPKQKPDSFAYEMNVPETRLEDVRGKIADFLAQDSVLVEKTSGKTVDARPPVKELVLDGSTLRLVLASQAGPMTGPEASVREILVVLGLEDELFRTIFPNRVKSYIVDELQSASSTKS